MITWIIRVLSAIPISSSEPFLAAPISISTSFPSPYSRTGLRKAWKISSLLMPCFKALSRISTLSIIWNKNQFVNSSEQRRAEYRLLMVKVDAVIIASKNPN